MRNFGSLRDGALTKSALPFCIINKFHHLHLRVSRKRPLDRVFIVAKNFALFDFIRFFANGLEQDWTLVSQPLGFCVSASTTAMNLRI